MSFWQSAWFWWMWKLLAFASGRVATWRSLHCTAKNIYVLLQLLPSRRPHLSAEHTGCLTSSRQQQEGSLYRRTCGVSYGTFSPRPSCTAVDLLRQFMLAVRHTQMHVPTNVSENNLLQNEKDHLQIQMFFLLSNKKNIGGGGRKERKIAGTASKYF